MAAKINYKQIMSDATERYRQIIDACTNNKDYNTTVSLVCSSLYSGEDTIPINDIEPVLEENFHFTYKGYEFELSPCTILTDMEQMIGITNENFIQKFPNGVFTDRYVCWMWGHDEPEPTVYLIPNAWSWGANYYLKVGSKVDKNILAKIDEFLKTFNEYDNVPGIINNDINSLIDTLCHIVIADYALNSIIDSQVIDMPDHSETLATICNQLKRNGVDIQYVYDAIKTADTFNWFVTNSNELSMVQLGIEEIWERA